METQLIRLVRPVDLPSDAVCSDCDGEGTIGDAQCPECRGMGEILLTWHWFAPALTEEYATGWAANRGNRYVYYYENTHNAWALAYPDQERHLIVPEPEKNEPA